MAPPYWTAPGNDYRGILEVEPAFEPRVKIVVLGDGDPIDVSGWDIEQSGAASLEVVSAAVYSEAVIPDETDVVMVIETGMTPTQEWLQHHLRWHRRARNVVVIGPNTDPGSNALIRGSRQFVGNDEGFAAFTCGNVSMPAQGARSISGIDPVSGWALWNDGCFFVYDPETAIPDSTIARLGDEKAPLVMEDAIPHRRFRKMPSAFHGTPKVSWVVPVTSRDEARSAWETCQQSSFADHEIVFHGPEEALVDFAAVTAHNARVSVVTDGDSPFGSALAATRGELVALLDPGASLAPETLDKALSRFEAKPSAPVVRVGYDIEGGRYLRLDDLAAVDAGMGRDGLPLFAVVTRRELMKDPDSLDTPATAWQRVLERSDQSLVVSPLVGSPAAASFRPRKPGLAEAAALGARETARQLVREARRRRLVSTRDLAPPDETSAQPTALVSVAYVGFTGHDNLGDEAVRVAIERMMPWASFEAEPIDPQLLMVGGGTLINGRRYYLNRMLRQESDSVERALFGTGVRNPEYWGVTEPMEDWFDFIDSSLYASLRGPDSVRNLRTLGYHRDLPIIGDPALFLEAPEGTQRVEGRVVICPVFTDGNLHGGNDDVVFEAFARLIRRLIAEGRDVVMLSAFPRDDRWVIDIMRRAMTPDLAYLAAYADIDETMALLGSADVVVGERLHAAIMGAAAGTPFVAVEYRPKLRDFARSVDQERVVIRTDEMDRLDAVFDQVVAEREVLAAELDEKVAVYRRLQKEGADELHERFMAR